MLACVLVCDCENVCICFYVLHWTQSYWILLLNFNNIWLSRYLQFSLDLLAVRRSPAWLKSLSQAADAGMAVFTLRDNFLTCGKECNTSIPPLGHERCLSSSPACVSPVFMDAKKSSLSDWLLLERASFSMLFSSWALM